MFFDYPLDSPHREEAVARLDSRRGK